jgi:hypothetical protein
MLPTLRGSGSSGWLPASTLALAAAVVVGAYGTPIPQVAIFGAYVAFGIALPGMLWVRLLRGRATHVSEDLTLGLAAGYCLEVASYLAARAAGAPQLFLLWPVLTLLAFAAVPTLRRYWRSDGSRAPTWWSWSLAAMLGYLLVFSAGTFFAQHQIAGNDTPYVDMPYHLALIGELRHHVPPAVPYVTGVPLAYHWFFYAEAAATSWATGIGPVALLYRLSGLPMFVAFVVLTATAARRLIGGWWTGPVAVAVTLFGTVAGPYRWASNPVFDSQALGVTWISPTNLFGLALFAAVIVAFFDLLRADRRAMGRDWLLIGLLIFGLAGAKATLPPLLIVGLVVVIAGVAIHHRQLHRSAAVGLAFAVIALGLAAILLFRGSTGGLVIGLDSLRSLPIIALPGTRARDGASSVILPAVGWLAAVVLWSFLWAGTLGLLVRRRGSIADPRILLLLGICAGALGAVTVFSYPGLSQVYYLKGAAGAFGLLTTAGIAAVLPERARYVRLCACVAVVALVGGLAALLIGAIGPGDVPSLARAHLSGLIAAIILPLLALIAVAVVADILLARLASRSPLLRGAAPLLVIAMVMGFSLPNVLTLLVSPFAGQRITNEAIPSDGIVAARWLRDHSDPTDLVATNLHCRGPVDHPVVCDARHFWVSGYSERRVLVEGWAYTQPAMARAT